MKLCVISSSAKIFIFSSKKNFLNFNFLFLIKVRLVVTLFLVFFLSFVLFICFSEAMRGPKVDIEYQKAKHVRDETEFVLDLVAPDMITFPWVIQSLPPDVVERLGVNEHSVVLLSPESEKLKLPHVVSDGMRILVTAPCTDCEQAPNRAIRSNVAENWELCEKCGPKALNSVNQCIECLKKKQKNEQMAKEEEERIESPMLPLRTILLTASYGGEREQMCDSWYKGITCFADGTTHNHWTPSLGALHVKCGTAKKPVKWNDWVIHPMASPQAFPLSPLCYDQKKRVRIVMGLETTEKAVKNLVEVGVQDWEKKVEGKEVRPNFLIWICGHGGSLGLRSGVLVGQAKEVEKIDTLSACTDLLRGVSDALKSQNNRNFHPIIFFDWCNSLQSVNTQSTGDWWTESKNPNVFKNICDATILGWTKSSTMHEGAKELAWISSFHDLVSDSALEHLTTGAGSPVRRIEIKNGKRVSSKVFEQGKGSVEDEQ